MGVDRPATLRDPSRAPIDVVIDNLSETGALLRAESALPVGTLVSLGIAGIGLRLARVVRVEPTGMAVDFMLPIDATAIARARTAETLVSVAFPQIAPGDAAVRPPPSVELSSITAPDPRTHTPVATPAPSAGGRPNAIWLVCVAIAVVLLALIVR